MNLLPIIESYNQELDAIPTIYQNGGGGDARHASGLLYENLIKRTCKELGLDARKNDYVKTEKVNGHCLENLQVDWHIYKDNVLKYLVESKTYLDACYLKRAIMDFIELEQSPDVPSDAQYSIFAGQNAVGDAAFSYYPAFFKKITGKEVKIFFINPTRKRSSSRPIYKQEFKSLFNIDNVVYNEFIEWLNK